MVFWPRLPPSTMLGTFQDYKTIENTLLGFKYVQITIVLGGEGTASAVLDTAQNANNLVKKSCVSQVFTPSKASVIRKIRLFGIL